MDVHQTYCGNLFMMYVSQIIVLYILNINSAISQLYLNKTINKYCSLALISTMLSIYILYIILCNSQDHPLL